MIISLRMPREPHRTLPSPDELMEKVLSTTPLRVTFDTDSEQEDWDTCASSADTRCADPTDSDGDGLTDYLTVRKDKKS